MVSNRFKLNVNIDNLYNIRGARKKVKDKIAEVLSNNGFIVDPQFENQPVKLSVFSIKIEGDNEKICDEYLLSVHASSEKGLDLSISFVGEAKFALLEKTEDTILNSSYVKYIENNTVRHTNKVEDLIGKFVKIPSDIMPCSYKERYNKVKSLIEKISSFNYDFFTIDTKFEEVNENDVKIFYIDNPLLFKDNNTGNFSYEGLEKYGFLKQVETPRTFLIIASNQIYAERISHYLEQFSDFERYLGFSYKEYPSIILKKDDTVDIQGRIPQDAYVILAVDDNNITHRIQQNLLEKGIPFSLFETDFVMNDSFYISIPEIMLSIQYKMGGIPFLLNTQDTSSAVCGVKSLLDRYGNLYFDSVVFDGTGRLLNVFATKGDMKTDLAKFVSVLRKLDLDKYFFHISDYIAYMKDSSLYHSALRELGKPYALTVFDTIHPYMDIVFDTSDKRVYMPINGTCVYVGDNKRLLFNNNKYTRNSIINFKNEPAPISIRNFIYKNKIDEDEVIEKVFLFSYLNYRSFKKHFLPSTTYYTKKLMEQIQYLKLPLPDNEVARKSLWFI